MGRIPLARFVVWLVWWSDASTNFRVSPVQTTERDYDRLIEMRLGYDSEQEADQRAKFLNDWMDEPHALGETVPAGNHIARFEETETLRRC